MDVSLVPPHFLWEGGKNWRLACQKSGREKIKYMYNFLFATFLALLVISPLPPPFSIL
jgi:hypothetical protein